MQKEILAKEREGLDALRTGNIDKFADLTADDALFIDAQGPARKAELLKHFAGIKLNEYAIDDVNFVPIASETGLIAYTLTESGNSHGKDFTAKVFVSALWTKHGDKWLCMFSQETAAK